MTMRLSFIRLALLPALALLSAAAGPASAERFGRGPGSVQPFASPSTDNGGYVVSPRGFGNYVGGPGGGFAGYPQGSAGAQIYLQQQEYKCIHKPERC